MAEGRLQNCIGALYESIAVFVGDFNPKVVADDSNSSGARLFSVELIAAEAFSKGTVSLAQAVGPPSLTTVTIRLARRNLVTDFDDMVVEFDRLWARGWFEMIYVYDEDDLAIQNLKMPFAAPQFGITEEQYDILRRGPVTEIDIRHNPGYLTYQDGRPISIQWLNYWHNTVAARLVGSRRSVLDSIVDVTDLNGPGGLRLRLSAEPWAYDNVFAHERQLRCRSLLGWL